MISFMKSSLRFVNVKLASKDVTTQPNESNAYDLAFS